ncbi:hypothetical protein DPMN_030165 [Dreissena polymorpha]|uniref:Uncharacterized protein n=1 Tax=Dreissena polymorpha TaxID=45954 RepID=A0A9D4LZF4_DREPO|nr:hypothetical protein DPMN_030165 [Dreissena polymorpha]
MKLTLQLPDGKRVSFHVDEETYRLVVDEKGLYQGIKLSQKLSDFLNPIQPSY